MKWHKYFVFAIIFFLVPSIFAGTTSTVGSGVEGDGEGECSIYYPNNFGEDVTTVLHCEDSPGEGGDDGDDDESVEILDGCKVTCTDPHDPLKQYFIKATGTVNMETSEANDYIGNIDVLVTYSDTEGNLLDMYRTHVEHDYGGDTSFGRGLVAYFGPSVSFPITQYYEVDITDLLVEHTDPNYVDIDYYDIGAYNMYASKVWPLFYASDLLFTLTGSNIQATYEHRLDFTTCADTFLEFYFCGSSGYNLCPYTDETAFLACYMHEGDEKRAIVTVDSQGHLDV